MGTDIEKLVDLMIQERMQSQFAKWREAETGKEKKADYLRLETEYEKAISALSEEQKNAVRHYCDSIFDSGAESECFFYRLGLKDGIRLWKFMKKLMAARQQNKEQERSSTKKSVLDALRSLKAKKQDQPAQEQDKPKKAKKKGMEL